VQCPRRLLIRWKAIYRVCQQPKPIDLQSQEYRAPGCLLALFRVSSGRRRSLTDTVRRRVTRWRGSIQHDMTVGSESLREQPEAVDHDDAGDANRRRQVVPNARAHCRRRQPAIAGTWGPHPRRVAESPVISKPAHCPGATVRRVACGYRMHRLRSKLHPKDIFDPLRSTDDNCADYTSDDEPDAKSRRLSVGHCSSRRSQVRSGARIDWRGSAAVALFMSHRANPIQIASQAEEHRTCAGENPKDR
jgi:hypothetical protein